MVLLVFLCLGGGLSAQEPGVDHAGLIGGWNAESFARGRKLYEMVCQTCHGTPTQAGSLPTSRPFWKEPFKNGGDPFSLYRTLSEGLGQMPAWTFLQPGDRYDVIHYLREEFVRPQNPSAYFQVTSNYLAQLPKGTGPVVITPEMEAFRKGPPYLRMEFGPALFWTLQVTTGNIAYKGIAVRVDDGPGGISKGRAWMLYDHDTLRLAAAWTGDKFVDWKGIAFDGSHQTHTSIQGDIRLANPVGPGWAKPGTEDWADPRFRGRDDKPYGPLPRDWARFRGAYSHSNQVVLAYSVGETSVLESPGLERHGETEAFSRTLNISAVRQPLWLRAAPEGVPLALVPSDAATLKTANGFQLIGLAPSEKPLRLKILVGKDRATLADLAAASAPPIDLEPLTHGGPSRWNPPVATRGKAGSADGPFAVDELTHPSGDANPWQSWMRFGGFDFFPDGGRAAICTWNGDVWIVEGLTDALGQLTWKRIATGLFQPLGVRIVDGIIHVTCRDQLARLHDLNGDGEIDFIENLNNDHQVTEHFHEFAMGLQIDAAGNFYYAKSARHALPALVAHHGTLLRVSKDGRRTDILATGFRAANGVCVNDDGTFFVTDQEGHWTPKNRINWVRPGRFYGNMFGYHDRTSTADADMEPPIVWITNDMDRSPGELVRLSHPKWGALQGGLLNLSYGTGRMYFVTYEKAGDQLQGGVVALPIPDLPTGVMRGRIHPITGDLYACGMYAWAGNRQGDGGFYRIRPTGRPAHLPVSLHARVGGVQLGFSDPLDPATASDPARFSVKTWSLSRTANYGSKHLDEHPLRISRATLRDDGKTVFLEMPDLQPTWGMEIKCSLRGADGQEFTRTLHNTIHRLGPAPRAVWRLDSPQEYQVFQRTNHREGKIVIAGRYPKGISGSVMVEVRRGDIWWPATWNSHAKGGLHFQVGLTLPAGGWFPVEVRLSQGGAIVAEARIEHVGVGEVFVVAGQSNSANHGEQRQSSRTGRVASFSGNAWGLAHDPQPGASGSGGSFLPPFGDALAERLNVPIGLIACGVGATSVREWLPKGSKFPNPPTLTGNVLQSPDGHWESRGNLFESFAQRLRSVGPRGFRAVLWHQGESDANQADSTRTLPGQLYQQYLEQLILATRQAAGWDLPWFVAQASYHVPSDPGSEDIRAAQRAVCQTPGVHAGPDTDQLGGAFRDSGGAGVHFSGPGLREHGARWAQRVIPWLEGLEPSYK